MKRNALLYSGSLLFLLCACKKPITNSGMVTPTGDLKSVISRASIDNYITNSIKSKGDFKWAEASDEQVWSALSQSDKVLSVGYKPAGWAAADVYTNIHTINVQSKAWQEAKDAVLQLIWEEERKAQPNLKIEKLEVWPEKYLPVMCVQVQSLSTISKLRQSNLVRYAEPIGYNYKAEDQVKETGDKLKSTLGCTGALAHFGNLLLNNDYSVISPLAKVSWNYSHHRIEQSWPVSSGKGIKVMVVDTGCSLNQEGLNGSFNQGASYGRTMEHLVTLPRDILMGVVPYGPQETPQDMCGHGTTMAGVIGAPRGTRGGACGIAYNCDLVTVRASADVILDESREKKGVADAFDIAANRDDIKIISMSMGYPFYISQVADAVQNAINRGKLVFCAAGTSNEWTNWLWVAFPASMPDVNAVTGIKDNLRERCSVCHEGDKVGFVVVMEKGATGLHVLSLAMNGENPSIVGGSSVATASMAGMAAMVWSRYPKKSASEIVDILKASAVNPDHNSNWGAGIVKMDKALGID
ncbi:MAG: serine protease [Pedobacter sp.]|nr:MAG: serine protease [Pedobacter sp.]